MTHDETAPPSLEILEITYSNLVIARALYAFAKLGIRRVVDTHAAHGVAGASLVGGARGDPQHREVQVDAQDEVVRPSSELQRPATDRAAGVEHGPRAERSLRVSCIQWAS